MATVATPNIVANLVGIEPSVTESADFSLVLGGPLYQLLRRSRLAGDALQLLHRRIAVLTAPGMATIFQLSVTTLTPVLPLMLTMISLEELLTKLLQMAF